LDGGRKGRRDSNFFVDKIFKDQYFGTGKLNDLVEIPKGRG
jgi:hypothetical protein